MSAAAVTTVPAGAEAVADASSSPAAAAAPGAASAAGLKSCSACSRSLHASAFSATQAKGPAKTRKCMECVVAAGKAAEAAAASAAIAAQVAAARAAKAAAAAEATASSKGKGKANTPGAIARERAAARNPPTASSSSSSSSSAVHSASAPTSAATSSSVIDPGPKLTKGLKTAVKKPKSAQQSIFDKSRKSLDQTGKAALLDEDEEWFLPRAEEAFEEIFRRFDSGHPLTAQPAAEKLTLGWSLADTQRFAMATNGREFGTEELIEIADNLEHNSKGQLTLQGFLDFYHLQTTSHPDETWKDLKKLGYDDKLELVK